MFFSENVVALQGGSLISHSIHGTDIVTYICLIFMVNVQGGSLYSYKWGDVFFTPVSLFIYVRSFKGVN